MIRHQALVGGILTKLTLHVSFFFFHDLSVLIVEFFFNFYFYFILLYNTVLVLPYIDMNPPRVYM